jgi:hypothetical protein
VRPGVKRLIGACLPLLRCCTCWAR